jgi:hypothetical protein
MLIWICCSWSFWVKTFNFLTGTTLPLAAYVSFSLLTFCTLVEVNADLGEEALVQILS